MSVVGEFIISCGEILAPMCIRVCVFVADAWDCVWRLSGMSVCGMSSVAFLVYVSVAGVQRLCVWYLNCSGVDATKREYEKSMAKTEEE